MRGKTYEGVAVRTAEDLGVSEEEWLMQRIAGEAIGEGERKLGAARKVSREQKIRYFEAPRCGVCATHMSRFGYATVWPRPNEIP